MRATSTWGSTSTQPASSSCSSSGSRRFDRLRGARASRRRRRRPEATSGNGGARSPLRCGRARDSDRADGPYGFDPAAADYDARLVDILRSERLDFVPLAEHVEAARADSLWQLLILQGAMEEDAHVDLLAYAAPSYYGMAVPEVCGSS